MNLFRQIRLSFSMTALAMRMMARYPTTLLVGLANLVFLVLLVAVPIGGMILLAIEDEDAAWWALNYVFQFWPVTATVTAAEAGRIGEEAVVGVFMTWLLFIYTAWATLVAFATLVTTTVIMHTGVMQLRGERPSLAAGFHVARENWTRLLALALITGVLMGLARRFLGILRRIPVVGRFAVHAIVAALTGALYLTLPIVVYERRGAWGAFTSTWRHIRESWGGLTVGTGLVLTAVWVGMWFVDLAVLAALKGLFGIHLGYWTDVLILQLVAAVLLYALNVTLAANLRAALYLHVTEGLTGHLPEGVFVRPPTPPAGTPTPAPPARLAAFEVVGRR